MNISAKVLESLKACEEGYKNFVKYHPTFNGTLAESLLLPNIAYENKLWLISTVVDKNILEKWVEDCIVYIIFSYPESYLNGDKIKGTLTNILTLLNSTSEEEHLYGVMAAEAFKDIVCIDYPEQKDINLQLLIQLL